MPMARSDFYCRPATEADLPETAAIYTQCARAGDDTFDDCVDPADVVPRYRDLLSRQPPFVVAAAPGRVLGFAHCEPYHPGSGFTHCVRGSVWVRAAHRRRGVGTDLLRALLLGCRQAGYRQATALVMRDNVAGLALHRRLGFSVMGWHRGACLVGGELRDVLLLRHDLWRHGTPPEEHDAVAFVTPDSAAPMVSHA